MLTGDSMKLGEFNAIMKLTTTALFRGNAATVVQDFIPHVFPVFKYSFPMETPQRLKAATIKRDST